MKGKVAAVANQVCFFYVVPYSLEVSKFIIEALALKPVLTAMFANFGPKTSLA